MISTVLYGSKVTSSHGLSRSHLPTDVGQLAKGADTQAELCVNSEDFRQTHQVPRHSAQDSSEQVSNRNSTVEWYLNLYDVLYVICHVNKIWLLVNEPIWMCFVDIFTCQYNRRIKKKTTVF